MTKTADGNQSFHKSLLSKEEAEAEIEASIFNRTPNTVARILQTFDEQTPIVRQNNLEKAIKNDSMWTSVHEDEDDQVPPLLDLSNFDWELRTDNAGYLELPKDCMPQSLAFHGSKIYISDVFNNCIMLFENFNFAGYWPAYGLTLNVPRYVTCLPEGQVLVLDETRLVMLSPEGDILDQFVNAETCQKFRGLTFIEINDTLKIITTQKVDHKQPVNLIFFNMKLSDGIQTRMNITSDYNDSQQFLSKIVFAKAGQDRIYVSDFGNGIILDTDTRFYTTK